MELIKKLSSLVIELLLRDRKLNTSFVLISQPYFKVPKDIRLNVTHSIIMKIPNKREVQQIAFNYLSHIEFKDFMKFYKDFSKELFSFLVNGTTLPSDSLLRFRKKLF